MHLSKGLNLLFAHDFRMFYDISWDRTKWKVLFEGVHCAVVESNFSPNCQNYRKWALHHLPLFIILQLLFFGACMCDDEYLIPLFMWITFAWKRLQVVFKVSRFFSTWLKSTQVVKNRLDLSHFSTYSKWLKIGTLKSKQQKFTSACQESVWIKLRPGAKNIQPI